MNQPDGTVKIAVEGSRDSVSSMIQTVCSILGPYITATRQSWHPATGEFRSFGIRHHP